MPASTYGRQVILPLVNKSGGQVIAGDVVITDTTNNDAFTTTTTTNYTKGTGVVQETIANNATGRVLISGYAALVNVQASVTRGNFGATYSVAKQATDVGSTRGTGTFCQFLTGGTTPDALVYPSDLGGASLTNPMTTTGDIIYSSDNSGTPARKGIGSTAQALVVAGGIPAWAEVLPWRIDINPYVGMSVNTGFADVSIAATQWANRGMSSTAQNDQIGCDIILAAGTWSVFVHSYRFTSRGISTLSLDGSSLGTLDWYGTDTANFIQSITSISVAATAKKAFLIKMATKNGSSSGYGLWLSWVTWVRTA